MKKIGFIILLISNILNLIGVNSDFQAFQSRTIEGGSINSSMLFYCDIYLSPGVQPKINNSTLIGVDFYQLDDDGNTKKCDFKRSNSSLIIGKTGLHAFCVGALLAVCLLKRGMFIQTMIT